MSKDLIRQLKALKHEAVKPNTGWVESNRALLLSQIKNTIPRRVSVPVSQRVAAAFSIFMPESLVSGAVRFAAIFIIVSLVGPSLYYGTVKASESSLPGDGLYGAKRYTEKIQVTLIGLLGDNKTVTKFHVELAMRRADETRRIVNDPGKVSNVASSMADLRSEIATIGDKLNQNDGALAADVAQDIKHNTDQIKEVLQGAKDDLLAFSTEDSDSLAQDVKATKDLVQDVSTMAVEVMVTKHLEGDTSVSKDEVKEAINSMVQNSIDNLTQSIQNIDGMQSALQTVKTAEAVSSTKDFNTVFDNTLQAVQVSDTISAEAARKVEDVTRLLGTDQLEVAVGRMKDLTQVTRDVENISDTTVTQSQTLLPILQVLKEVAAASSTNVMSSTVIIVTSTEPNKITN